MKKIIWLIILLLAGSLALAEDSKIDTLLIISKKTGKQVDELYKHYKNDPLAGKTWGIEINPVRLIAQLDGVSTFSGGFSYFGKPMMEIYFPYYYYLHNYDLYSSNVPGVDQMFYADARIRLFTGNTSNGFFLSGLVRYASIYNTFYLKGYDQYNYWEDEFITGMEPHRENKLGIGFGFGWRSFSYRGFYWAFSLSAGRYFIGDNQILHDNFPTSILFLEEATNDNDLFFDVEILKFGFAF